MSNKEYFSLTKEQQTKAVQHHMDYLEKEGVVVKMKNDKYRLKTKKEIQQELKNILNS